MRTVPESEAKPVLLLGSIAAGALVLASGLPLLTPDRFDWIGPAIGLGAAVITAGLTKFTEGKTVPSENVAARALPREPGEPLQLVAGDAVKDIPTDAPVSVSPSTETNWAG